MGFFNLGYFVFDVVRETAVEDMVECAVTVTVDLAGEAVELNHILVYSLSILHGQVVQLVLHLSDRVMWTEVRIEFLDKLLIVVHPYQAIPRVTGVEQVQLKPLEGHAL